MMENQTPPKANTPADEIDLGQLFKMIGDGFGRLFRAFLRVFLYIKRNAIKFGILLVVGLGIGIGLNNIVTKKLKTEVIVKPNLESKNYLYDVVNEIDANIRAKDLAFFNALGIEEEELKGLSIMIEPVEEENGKNSGDDLEYIELLQKFRNDELITDIVRSEVLNKSTLNHRISIFYKDAETGKKIATALMEYINSNDYFNELVKLNKDNATMRIERNEQLVQQIDLLVDNYAKKIAREDTQGDGRIVLDNEDQLDVTGLLSLKNGLIKEIELKKVELQDQKEAIRIINFGKPQEVQQSFFGKNIVLIPVVLIGIFLLIDTVKYLSRKASEMELQQ